MDGRRPGRPPAGEARLAALPLQRGRVGGAGPGPRGHRRPRRGVVAVQQRDQGARVGRALRPPRAAQPRPILILDFTAKPANFRGLVLGALGNLHLRTSTGTEIPVPEMVYR